MKGDFSRFTFDQEKHYSRVLLQQGRILLDADWNEMIEIVCQDHRNLARDLIGPFGGPVANCGFRIAGNDEIKDNNKQIHRENQPPRIGDFFIGEGRYYVDGIPCENPNQTTYCTQPDLPSAPLEKGRYLVYLDVWERHITYLEDHEIREVSLGGSDTATRTRVVWQVKTHRLSRAISPSALERSWQDFVRFWQPKNRGRMAVGIDPDGSPPIGGGGYTGFENHLYRVEIHHARSGSTEPTFKWSRENGSVTYAIDSILVDASNQTTTVTLDRPLQAAPLSLRPDNWVELLDDTCILGARPGILLRAKEIDGAGSRVVLHGLAGEGVCRDPSRLCILRRWDQKQSGQMDLMDGAVVIREGLDDDSWQDLENGIRIRFQPGGNYRSGDYWLIPARAESGGIDWPTTDGEPLANPPMGIDHHFAPLAVIKVNAHGKISAKDCRWAFRLPLVRPVV